MSCVNAFGPMTGSMTYIGALLPVAQQTCSALSLGPISSLLSAGQSELSSLLLHQKTNVASDIRQVSVLRRLRKQVLEMAVCARARVCVCVCS